jgi:hypothetical protein
MANNFIKDFLGFGVPDIYSGIFKDPKQLEELNTQGLKRGATFGLLNYLTQPKNQNYGSALPYIGQAVGTGLQAYQGTLDAGLANALKAKALETDDIPKIGAINAGDYTVESLANYQKTKNLADLVKKPDATTTKGMTDAEIMQLETAFPGFKADEQTKALLRTDRTQGLDLFKQKYTTKADQQKYTGEAINSLAKANFGGKINSATGELYPENATYADLNPKDALSVLDAKQKREIDLINAESNAKYNTPEGQWSRITTLNNKYEQALKANQFDEMEKAFKQVQLASRAGTPIGDVASAIKIMKLLDPGSVVRESELGIALNQTSGLVDRWTTFVNRKYTGQQLTPTQREEFRQIASDFYNIAQQSKNKLDQRFINYAKGAGVDPSLVVGSSGGYLEYDEETGEFK